MARQEFTITQFNGGLSSGRKQGLRGSFDFARSLDIHSDPSYFEILPKTTKDSGSTVTDLVVDAVRTENGDCYFLDLSKKFYKRTAAGVWSTVATISSGTNGQGLYYWRAKDTIYVITDQTISTYFPISGTPAISDGKYATVIDQQISVTGNASYPESTSIQGHWTMDESSGNATDSSGNGNHLTDTNTVGSSTDKQQGTRSRDFEAGNSEYFTITDAAQTGLDMTGDFSITLWVKLESAPALNTSFHFVDKWGAAGQLGYTFTYRNAGGTLQLQCDLSSDGTAVNTEVINQTLTVGTWYHLAVVYDASAGEVDFYVDAVATGGTQSGAPTSIFNNTEAFKIGSAFGGGNYMDGLIDDVVIWNFELTAANITSAKDAAAGTYTLGTSISEAAADKFSFTPDLDPHVNVVIPITAKGTGNWTVTVHDDNNNTITSKTIANASLTSSADNTFTFANNWRTLIDATYHLHVTSTVANGTMTSGTDVIDTTAARMVDPKSGAHPVIEFTTFLAIANERYLMTFDGLIDAAIASSGKKTTSFNHHKLTFPSGYEMQCVSRFDQFIVMGLEYRGDNVDDFSQGLIAFWDGVSASINYFIEVNEGGIQLILPIKNRLYFVAGNRGELFVYGGDDYLKVKRFPKTSDKKYVRTSWACATIYQGMPLFGMAFDTDSTTFEQGVYSYGQKEALAYDVMNYDYPISSGTRTGTTLKIGLVKAFGTDLFIGWRDASTYGVDIVTPSANPFATATYESRFYDFGKPYKDKQLFTLRADHDALPSGASVQIGYKVDDDTSFTTNTANSTADSTSTRFSITAVKFKELAINCNVAAATATPRIRALTVEYDDSEEETIV